MVSSTRSQLDPVVRRVIGDHGPIVRTMQLLEAGVHPRTIYGLRNGGMLEAVGRGLYRLPTEALPEHFDLLVVARRAPHAVVCLVSALSFHGLTDEVPHEVSIAIPRNGGAPKIDTVPTRVFRFAEALYQLGVEHHRDGDIDLKVYSPSKSIIDAFRFRHRIGEDVAIAALASGLRTRKVRPGPLLDLAGKLRARNVIAPYVKALT
jgi:predicted transcriptional regulator of viral defense system